MISIVMRPNPEASHGIIHGQLFLSPQQAMASVEGIKQEGKYKGVDVRDWAIVVVDLSDTDCPVVS